MENALFDNFTNMYPVQKTLRFELRPQGKTLENIEKEGIIDEDKHRAESYKVVKKIIDEYHKAYINEVLKKVELTDLDKYLELYNKQVQTDQEKKSFEEIEGQMREQIVHALKKPDKYKMMFSKNLIQKELLEFVGDDEEKRKCILEFKQFTTYFQGFFKNRENMYSDEAKSTAISYRVINQNLPKFVDNMNQYNRICNSTLSNQITEDDRSLFDLNYYIMVLSQAGIDEYNLKIGAINMLINEYNQKLSKDQRNQRIGKLKPLYKQILSDRERLSFIPEKIENDQELLNSIKEYDNIASEMIKRVADTISGLYTCDLARVYIKNDRSITDISKQVFGDWNAITSKMYEDYDEHNLGGKKKLTLTYEEKRKKAIKGIASFSIRDIENLMGKENVIIEHFTNCDDIINEYNNAAERFHLFVSEKYPETKSLINDDASIEIIKKFLDSIKAYQRFLKPLLGAGTEAEKDEKFYADFLLEYEAIDTVTPLYNKVRNYVTQKPYSTEKIKLNFGNAELLDGWDLNKEESHTAIILRKKDLFYLAIMPKSHNKVFRNIPESKDEDVYEKMDYKLLPGPNKMLPKVCFAKSREKDFEPSDEVIRIRKEESFKKSGDNFNKSDLHKLIDFYKESISRNKDWESFGFVFSSTDSYEDISGFYREVESQGYKISFRNIPADYINALVDKGEIFLFQIYNKDFSPYSKGTPNMHTLYWKMLFDNRNIKNPVYKLDGGAEVFFRKASINKKDRIVHPAQQPINNKNKNNKKNTSTFEYELIKDRRYTVDKFQFHVPITINFTSNNKKRINEDVNICLKYTETPYVIGMDRGERNLLYLVVIDPEGKIVEQRSLNKINSGNDEVLHTTDYHLLLDEKEQERDKARKDWKTINNIKELKEGYLSQVVYTVTSLMRKYNAILVLEDLNMGFMRGRQKVEKQVYQKFEKKIIDKLNYLVDKKTDPDDCGGLLHAYQLTNEFESFKKMGKQNGMLFYIPAWNTSKMDPTTGFVDLLYVKYESVGKARAFWEKFSSIKFNEQENYFEFCFDYNNFTAKAGDSRTKWTVCSYGDRIKTFRNKDKNSQWDSKQINLTDEFKTLFISNDINYLGSDLISDITENDTKEFHEELIRLFKLTMQMRNSKTGEELDYLISPVKNAAGRFYDSREASEFLPENADANGAYNIARKGLWAVQQIKSVKDDSKLKQVKINITNQEWLKYAQENAYYG